MVHLLVSFWVSFLLAGALTFYKSAPLHFYGQLLFYYLIGSGTKLPHHIPIPVQVTL